MKISTDKNGSIDVVKLSGRLDAIVSRDLKSDLVNTVVGSETGIVLDMSGVDFIDSSGLGLLVSRVKQAGQNKKDISLCGLSPQAQLLFELTRMSRIFPIYSDADAAVQAMS